MTTLARAVVQAHELLCAPFDRVLADHPTERWLAREAVAFLVALTFVAPLSWVGRDTPFEVWGWLARALRVPLPIHRRTHGPDAYHRALVRVVANAIANERYQVTAPAPGARS